MSTMYHIMNSGECLVFRKRVEYEPTGWFLRVKSDILVHKEDKSVTV